MNQITADELVGTIAELRALFPEWRLGQLIGELSNGRGWDGGGGHLGH